MPETRPDLHIDDELICSACRNYDKRPTIDWQAREKQLLEILERYRSQDGSDYDCIIPVSGGKDSHYQVIKMLELGMNPLCVNAHPDQMSDLGRRNIDNLKRLGVDFIEISINPKIRGKIARLGLSQVGDASWAEHATIFTIPVRIAVQMNIPLLIWAENSQFEYGGPAAASDNNVLTRRWLEEFGGLQGMRPTDLIGQDGIRRRDLQQFMYPDDADLQRVGVTGLLLGYYLPWDGQQNALIAQAHGMEVYPTVIENQMVNYENLDNHINGLHEYFMYLKYGFGRATTQACTLIRHGRLARGEALEIVQKRDGRFPWTYLGKPLAEILAPMGLTVEEFIKICDRFTNKKVFKTDNRGQLIKDLDGCLIKINSDNP